MRDSRQLVAFVAVSGLAAAVNIAARAGFSLVTSYEVAIALAFPIALTTAFVLNRMFVFRATGSRALQFGRFLAVNVAALLQVWIVSVALARIVFPAIGGVWHGEFLAHAIGVFSPVATSYLAHKRYTFA